MPKPETIMNERAFGDDAIKASEIEMLETAIDEVKSGVLKEFILVKKINTKQGTEGIALAQAVHLNSYLARLADKISDILSK